MYDYSSNVTKIWDSMNAYMKEFRVWSNTLLMYYGEYRAAGGVKPLKALKFDECKENVSTSIKREFDTMARNGMMQIWCNFGRILYMLEMHNRTRQTNHKFNEETGALISTLGMNFQILTDEQGHRSAVFVDGGMLMPLEYNNANPKHTDVYVQKAFSRLYSHYNKGNYLSPDPYNGWIARHNHLWRVLDGTDMFHPSHTAEPIVYGGTANVNVNMYPNVQFTRR